MDGKMTTNKNTSPTIMPVLPEIEEKKNDQKCFLALLDFAPPHKRNQNVSLRPTEGTTKPNSLEKIKRIFF